MDKNKVLATLCFFGIALSGCGDKYYLDWKQNPLGGKSGNFDKGKPVPTKPDLAEPVATDSVFIETPSDFISTEEGMAVEFPIKGRVALEGYTAEVKIDNIDAFPGATYDPITGLFKWTPAEGFVQSTGSTELLTTVSLRIVVFGYRPDHQVLYNEASYPLAVYRGFDAPEVLSAAKAAEFIREGSNMDISVEIFDKDAIVTNPSTWPTLHLHPVQGEKSLGSFATVQRTTALGGNKYSVLLRFNLKDAEVTNSISDFRMGLVASSRFGQLSTMKEVSLRVYTSFSNPVSTWDPDTNVKVGETLNQTFLISDPKLEAQMELLRVDTIPKNAALNCKVLARGILSCTFTFTPTAEQVGFQSIRASVKMRNSDSRDTDMPLKSMNFGTTVLPQGS